MELFKPIKEIATEALDTQNPKLMEKGLRDILWYIAKEEEYWVLRREYYRR